MITVEMGHEDCPDSGWSNSLFLHRDEGRGPTVQEEPQGGALDQDTGLKPSPTAKSIATAEKCHSYISHKILSESLQSGLTCLLDLADA